LQIFLYVRNNFVYEPYSGFLKGVNGTLNSGGGNDFDQSALLVHMLREQAHIQARFAEGTITVNMTALGNWFGVETSNATMTILDQSRIPYHIQNDGTIQLGHVWVQAFLSGNWVDLDPSFKQYVYHQSMTVSQPLPPPPLENGTQIGAYGITNINLEQLIRDTEYYQAKATQAAKDLGPIYPTSYRVVIQSSSYVGPPDSKVEATYDEIPPSDQYFVKFTIPSFIPSINDFSFSNNVSVRYPTPLLGDSRVTFYFIPVDEGTLKYIQSFPRLLTDPNLDVGRVQMFPVLRFNSTYKVEGPSMPLGYHFPLDVRITFKTLSGGYDFSPTVGTWNSITIETGDNFRPDAILQQRMEQLNQTLHSLRKQTVDADDITGAMLDIEGRSYLDALDSLALSTEASFGVKAVHLVRGVMVGYRYSWVGNRIQYAGPYIDETGLSYPETSINDDRRMSMTFNLVYGAMLSILEGRIIQAFNGNAPISTVTLLEAANEQGIPIFMIDKDNWKMVAPQLSLPSTVMNEIGEDVNPSTPSTDPSWSGFGVVVVPQRPVTTTALTLTLSENGTSYEQVRTYRGIGLLYLNWETFSSGWRLNRISSTGSAPISLGGGDSGTVTETEDTFESTVELILSNSIEEAIYQTLELHPLLGVEGELAELGLAKAPSGVLTAAEIQSILMGAAWQSAGGQEFLQQWKSDILQNNAAQIKAMSNEQLANGYNMPGWLTQVYVWLGVIPQHPNSPQQAPALGLEQVAGGLEQEQVAGVAPDYPQFLRMILNVAFASKYTVDCYMNKFTSAPSSTVPGVLSIGVVDESGHVAGFDPLTGKSSNEINYMFEYNTTTPTLGLWDIMPGNYTILVANNGDQTKQMYLLGSIFSETNTRHTNVRLQLPSRTLLAIPTLVSYDSEGNMKVSLGSPSFAALIQLDSTAGPTISGDLLGPALEGLQGKSVQLFARGAFSQSWTYVGNVVTSTGGHFSFKWDAAPPGDSEIMAAYMGSNAFTEMSLQFPATIQLQDQGGQPIPSGTITIIANGKSTTEIIQNGAVKFAAYSGYNIITLGPASERAVFVLTTPASAITVQFNVSVATSATTTTAASVTSTSLGVPTGLPVSTIIASVVAVAALILVALLVVKKKRQGSKQTKET
jgi:hypothetical protein